MGKLETDTDSLDQYEEIGLDPLRTNGTANGANIISIEGSDTKSKSSASPSSTSSSLGNLKSVNLQYITLSCFDDGTNEIYLYTFYRLRALQCL